VRTLWESRRSNPAEWIGVANFAKTTSNIVARTRWLLAHPFQPYRYVHDWFFFAATAVERKLAVLDAMLLRYRAHPTNTIKSGEPGAVPREVVQMNFDLLRALAPRFATELELRANFRAYLRALLGNHTDFRGEVFVHLIAALVEKTPASEMAATISGLDVTQFPELAASSAKTLRAESELKRLLRFHEQSRWIALGRFLGVATLAPLDESLSAEKKLSAFKEALKANTWAKVGDALGQYRYTELTDQPKS